MKRKKGFTLIELLAVIVILAIIALITVPTVIKIINNAKKGAAEDSTYGAVDAAKLYWASHATFDNENESESEGVTFTCGNDGCKYNDDILDISGDKPTSGTITISSGNVTASNLVFGNFTCNLSNDIVTCGSDSIPEQTYGVTKVDATIDDTHKGIVYLDPTNLSNTCNADNSVSTPGTKNGCMKWYIYDDSGDNYTMILDHNTTALVAWNSSGNNADGMNEVATALANDTAGWQGSPRLITANEVARITGADQNGFDASQNGMSWFYFDSISHIQIANSINKSAYAWLFDYTNSCTTYGCNIEDSSTYGYWTSTPCAGDASYAWHVYEGGYLNDGSVDYADSRGVRPVITISKSVIN